MSDNKEIKISDLVDKILADIEKLSDEELQAEYDACRNGAVGRAILGK